MYKKELISANNLAKMSDYVFAEEVTLDDFKKLEIENLFIIKQDENYVCYLNKKIVLSENDIIFCKTDYVDLLFWYLRSIKNLQNLKLITSQSDLKINKSLFSKKPNCISEWYSTNVKHNNDKLISIPLGLANEFSKKNLNISDFQNFKANNNIKNKKQLIYSNFNINTKYQFRKKLISTIKDNKNFVIKKSDLDLLEYKNDLSKYHFVLCPPGNGIDTHRIWEAIYSNSIPIVFQKYYLDYFSKIPVVVLKTIDELINFDFNRKNEYYNPEVLFVEWWIQLIKKSIVKSQNKAELILNNNKLKNYFKIKIFKNIFFKFIKILISFYIKLDRKLSLEN